MTHQSRRGHADAPCDLTEGKHFFKIIFPENLLDGSLSIPKKFISKYGENLSNSVLLTKDKDKIWLQKGWREFAECYSVKPGYLLVFRYEENSHFHVLIFDPSTTEIDYPSKSSNGHEEGQCDDQGFEVLMEDTYEIDGIQILPNCPLCQPKRKDASLLPRHRPWKKMITTSTSGRIRSKKSEVRARIRQLTSKEKDKALKKASGFKSKNPHFMVVMQSSFVKAWYLSIPVPFIKKKYIKSGERVKLKVGDQSWKVLFCIAGEKRPGSFSAGWSKFARENDLKVEDVCVFELVKRTNNDVELEVSIFRD